jgi:hypothetical protein
MPNPRFPQKDEKIDSPWGGSVAGTVVRRYATEGERDADLAGFTPAQLLGMECVLTGQGGTASKQPIARMYYGPNGWEWCQKGVSRTSTAAVGPGSFISFPTLSFSRPTAGTGDANAVRAPGPGFYLLTWYGLWTNALQGGDSIAEITYVDPANVALSGRHIQPQRVDGASGWSEVAWLEAGYGWRIKVSGTASSARISAGSTISLMQIGPM